MIEAAKRGLIKPPPPTTVAQDVEKSFLPGANEAIANLLGIPVDAVNSVLKAVGMGTDRPVGGSKSIKQGMGAVGISTEPKESTTRQKVMAGAGRGTGAGALFGPGAVIPGAVGGASGTVAKEATAAMGGGEGAQLGAEVVGGLAGGQVAGTAQNLVAKAVNVARGGTATPTMEAMRTEGVTPRMAGDAAESRVTKQATAFLKDAPVTGGIIQKAAQESIDELALAVERRSAQMGPATSRADAGQAVQRGVQAFTTQVGHTATRLYGQLHRIFPGTTPVPATNTLQTVGDVTAALGQMPQTSHALTPALFRAIGDDLAANGTPSFATLSRLRTEIGKKLSDPMLVDDVGRADLKRIYGALSQDMRTALAQQPDALRLFDISSNFYRNQMQFIEGSFQKLAQHGVTPEALFGWATSEGRVGATRLAALRRAMGDNEFGNVSAVVFKQLGSNGGNAPFDPATFIRNWEKGLSSPAKRVLFDPDYTEAVDRIALISKAMQQTGALANTSRTAGTAQLLTWIGAIGGSVVGGPVTGTVAGIGTAIVSQATASKLLTSKTFAKWLATPVGPNGIPTHLKLLPQIAAREPQIQEEINEFLSAVAVAGDM